MTADDPLAKPDAVSKASDDLGSRRGVREEDADDGLPAGCSPEDLDRAHSADQPTDTTAHDAPPERNAPLSETDEDPFIPRRYEVVEGRICYLRTDRTGNETVVPLANFDARIAEEVNRDDGLEVAREFLITGRLSGGEALSPASVPAREFGGLGWVTGAWGARAVISAGTGTRDHLRAAIQVLSEPTHRTVFRHTGWRKVGGQWLFLYQGGAIGAPGGIEVDLDPPLDRFALPAAVEDARGAIQWSLRLLQCGPPQVMMPLLAAIYLAPLASLLEPDFTLWVHGVTGSLKSELATLAERHFGDFSRKSLPCSWTSTDNAIEHRLSMLKDVLVVIDDYAPHADARAEADQARKAQRVLRNVGNRAARGRMRPDMTGRPDRPPRGLPLVTGEMLPPGASILARLVPIEVDRERLNLSAITSLQEKGGRLAHAMRAFIEWLAPQYEVLQASLPAARDDARRQLRTHAGHLRQPEAMANLYMGIDLFSRFAEEVGGFDATGAGRLRDGAMAAFQGLSAIVGKPSGEIDPAERFIEALATLLSSSKVRVLAKRADRFLRTDDANVIGWTDGDETLLLPGPAYRQVAAFLHNLGERWNPGSRELYRGLRKKEYVIPTDGDYPDVQWRVGPEGQRVRGWALARGVLPIAAASLLASRGAR